MDVEELLTHALAARERAYAPYSRFLVGAAILCDDGSVFTGCNVENASYGLSNCAERSAVFEMVNSGRRKIAALAVVADAPRAISPCGACRQVLSEFAAADVPVLLANLSGDRKMCVMSDLLPYAFYREDFVEHE